MSDSNEVKEVVDPASFVASMNDAQRKTMTKVAIAANGAAQLWISMRQTLGPMPAGIGMVQAVAELIGAAFNRTPDSEIPPDMSREQMLEVLEDMIFVKTREVFHALATGKIPLPENMGQNVGEVLLHEENPTIKELVNRQLPAEVAGIDPTTLTRES